MLSRFMQRVAKKMKILAAIVIVLLRPLSENAACAY